MGFATIDTLNRYINAYDKFDDAWNDPYILRLEKKIFWKDKKDVLQYVQAERTL